MNRFSFIRVVFVAAIVAVVGACTAAKTLPTSQALAPTATTGLMLVSSAYSGGYSGYNMHFRKIGQLDKWQSIEIGAGMALLPPGMLNWDIEEPGLRGQTFAVPLEPGEYEFFSWHIASGYFHTRPVTDFSIRFTIEAGETYYVGRFTFLKQRNIGAAVTGVNVQHSDQWKFDRAILERKYPSVDFGKLKQVASGVQLSEYLGDGNSTTLILSPIVQVPLDGANAR